MNFYENLRVIREDRGYTQQEIANILETTRQYYGEYENGKRETPIRIYVILAQFYNVSIDYLAGLTGDSSPKSEVSIRQENNGNSIGIINCGRK